MTGDRAQHHPDPRVVDVAVAAQREQTQAGI